MLKAMDCCHSVAVERAFQLLKQLDVCKIAMPGRLFARLLRGLGLLTLQQSRIRSTLYCRTPPPLVIQLITMVIKLLEVKTSSAKRLDRIFATRALT
jgi:hypothetical protein